MQQYPMKNAAFVRFPYVIGRDDYTDRLYFYVEHVVRQKPMYIDNMDAQMSFISVDDAGRLLAHSQAGVRSMVPSTERAAGPSRRGRS